MTTVSPSTTGVEPNWLNERHRDWHANRPIQWKFAVDGCPECLLEIIWDADRALVEEICRQFSVNDPNHRPVEQYVRGHRFNASPHCIDAIFEAWLAKQLALATDE